MSTIMTIIAILAAPLIAVQASKWLEHLRERRTRKLDIFKTLMATRDAKVSPAHVRALNMIDLEFSGMRYLRKPKPAPADQETLKAWKVYREHLNEPFDTQSQEATAEWTRRGDGFFLEMLASMGATLGYSFDTVDLKRGAYTPKAFGDQEMARLFFMAFLLDVARGKRAIPMEVRQQEPEPELERRVKPIG